jgi:hypothetical protein
VAYERRVERLVDPDVELGHARLVGPWPSRWAVDLLIIRLGGYIMRGMSYPVDVAASLVSVLCAHTGQTFTLLADSVVVLEDAAHVWSTTLETWRDSAEGPPQTGRLCPLGNTVSLAPVAE